MELNNYKKKFKDLFDKFFNENFELSLYYSENLIKYLGDSSDKCVEKILQTPFFSDLILYSLTNLENATASVRTFIVKVVKIMTTNELQCSKMINMQGMKLIPTKLFKMDQNKNMPIALSVAGVEMCTATLSHSTGIITCIQSSVWTIMLSKKLHTQPPMIAKSVYNFISTLVWKLDEYDEEATLIEVLSYVVGPIKNNNYLNVKVLDAEKENAVYDSMLSQLQCLLVVVGETDQIIHPNRVIYLLSHYLFLEQALGLILEVTRDHDLICLVTRIFLRLNVGCSLCQISQNKIDDMAQDIIITYYNVLNQIFHKRLHITVISITVDFIMFWAKLDKNVVPSSFVRYGRTFDVQDQLLLITLIPVLVHSFYVNRQNPTITELLDAFYYKLSNLATEPIVKAAYTYRGLIENGNATNAAIESLKQLFKLKHYLNERQAGVVYQALYYILQHYVVSDQHGTLTVGETPMSSPDDIKILSLVLDLIKMLLKEHKINWYENVEIISLQNCLMNLLKQNVLPAKQLLQAVDLINLSIRKLLSPDLALLMESRQGSTLNEIVSLMKSFIQHTDWELRDSALNLLLSCTDLAYVKYIPLQKLLNENELMGLVAQKPVHDEEVYVQTTALRCLAAGTKIESIWRHAIVAQPNLCNQLVDIMTSNSEGIVRKEAAYVLLELYVHQKISAEFTEHLLNVMTKAALKDLHWEVQMIALQFWKANIQYELSNRGMIDGKFPAVTFCKVRRKIIALNEKVIEIQLTGIMNDLAASGCLTVLDKCLNDEHHIQVIEQAYNIAKELMSMLDCYKFERVPESTIVAQTEEFTPIRAEPEEMLMDLTLEAASIRQQVVDTIVDTNQCELIEYLYDAYDNVKSEPMETNDKPDVRIHKWMDPNKFMRSFRETDYITIIEDKKNWNSGPKSLDALLDEVLALGEVKHDIIEECS